MNSERSAQFHSAMVAFLESRRDEKLKGNDDPEARAKYELATWLADAARRVTQIQAVTHVLKATHPGARGGSSLHVRPDSLPQHKEIGTHVLGEDFAEDVICDAKQLDVASFLKIEVEGRRLLDWMRDGDRDLLAALHSDEAVASAWMAAFNSLVRSEAQSSSHTYAKQLYWLVGSDPVADEQFHILQPLFSSSLAHAVHVEIQEARFGESNKLARQAYFKRDEHPTPYRDYKNLVVRKIGGTKPQNISQLNSERRGVNYLLSSLPPTWRSDRMRSLLGRESALESFGYIREVRALIKELARFLLSEPEPNDETRSYRKELEQELGLQLAVFGSNVQAHFGAGWTRDPSCCLPQDEQLWLDPKRTELGPREGHEQEDREFDAAYTFGSWADSVAGRFANWVNARLYAAGLTVVGEAEYKHWAKQALIDTAWPIPLQRRAPEGGAA